MFRANLALTSISLSIAMIVGISPTFAGSIFKCKDAYNRSTFSDNPLSCTSKTSVPTKIQPNSQNVTRPMTSAATNKLLTDSVFAPTSFWYKPIPLEVPLDRNSDNLVKEFVRQKTTYYNNVIINTYSAASPVYIATADTKPVKVGFNNCQKKSYVDPVFMSMMSAVPIPENAKQSAGGDAEMTIYQPSTDTVWELWVSKKEANGEWSACWGGRLDQASKSSGIHRQYYGTTATGLPFLGGQVTAEELARGEIKHAIGISLVDAAAWDVYSWPANRSDGHNPGKLANRILEGQRFRLDPSINVDKLPMSKAGKTIAKAAQKYGFVVWDTAGSVGIRAQNATSYTAVGKADPYPALFEYKAPYAVLNGFPWDKLQFLPINYGKP